MSSSLSTFSSLNCLSATAVHQHVSSFSAFQSQLCSLCLFEFPSGFGNWRGDAILMTDQNKFSSNSKKFQLLQKYSVTTRDYNAQNEMVESLVELASSKVSPWKADYEWSDEAWSLRELSIKSPELINDRFILQHFRSLRIIDKGVTEVDENMLWFCNLESLTLTANFIQRVDSSKLPAQLKILELCANEVDDLAQLCACGPSLVHLGLGFNRLTSLGSSFTGSRWPELRSLDLCSNNLVDLASLVQLLNSLPKLRNLVLAGNPLALVPGYRGYTIDTLKELQFLDDVSISIDEKHHFNGIVEMTDCNILDARILLTVPYLKGLLPPEEIAHPEDLPEFPKISTRYLVQFMCVEDKLRPYKEEPMATISVPVEVEHSQQKTTSDRSHHKLANLVEPSTALQQPIAPPPTETSCTGLPLIAVRTLTSEWSNHIDFNWTKELIFEDLRLFRDFLREGMQVSIVEEKVLSYPVEEEIVGDSSLKTLTDKTSGKENDAKKLKGENDKSKAKNEVKQVPGKKKKGESNSVPLVASLPIYTKVASFHVPLKKFLESHFEAINETLIQEHPQPVKVPDVASAAAPTEPEKVEQKQTTNKKTTTGGKDKKSGKGQPVLGDDDGTIHPMEITLTVKLCHCKTASDI